MHSPRPLSRKTGVKEGKGEEQWGRNGEGKGKQGWERCLLGENSGYATEQNTRLGGVRVH